MRASRFVPLPLTAVPILALLLLAPAGRAEVDLELEGNAEPCISRVLEVDLYAASDDDSNQSIAAMSKSVKGFAYHPVNFVSFFDLSK